MRIHNFFLAFLMIATTLLLAAPRPAFACSCIAPPGPNEALSQSTAVFSGTVSEVDNSALDVGRPTEPVQVTFAVNQVWKGDVTQTTQVSTAADSAGCGYEFEVGQDYLVYANESEGSLNVSLCSRTQPLSAASEDLADLGSGNSPAAGEVETESSPARTLLVTVPIIAVAGLFLALVGAGVMVRRRSNT